MTDHASALTRAGWRGEAAAWEALVCAMPLLERAVALALRGYPEYRDRREELAQATLLSRAERALRDRGLSAGAQPPRSLEAWLARVFRNAAIDQLRAWRRRDRRGADLDLDQLIDTRVSASRVDLELAWSALGRLPPRYALAWILRHAPEALEPDQVRRACAAEGRARTASTGGLTRGSEDTWRGLERWRRRYAGTPSSHAARRELAWILRSRDTVDPVTWAARAPAEARRALDTLGTWERRAKRRLAQGR